METQRDEPAQVSAGELAVPEELSRRRLRARLLFAVLLVGAVVAAVTLLPGLGSLRSRLAHAEPGWLALGVALKLASGLGYVVVFRMIFCRRMSWRVSYQIGMSELGANALFPTGGAGGLALGAWALKRGGMQAREIARRTVAFFLLTSVPNVMGVILLGIALAIGLLGGESNLLLTALPAAVAAAAVVATLLAGRLAERWGTRLRQGDAQDSHSQPQAGESSQGLSPRMRALWKSVTAVGEGVREAVALLREGNLLLVAGLLAYLVFDVLILWAGFHALGAAPSLAVLSLAYLIGELGGLIPVPGGIGGVDAGLVGTLALYHVSLTSAAGAVLAYRAIALWVPAVAGGSAFVFLRRTLRNEAQEVAICAPQQELEIIGLGRVVVRGEHH